MAEGFGKQPSSKKLDMEGVWLVLQRDSDGTYQIRNTRIAKREVAPIDPSMSQDEQIARTYFNLIAGGVNASTWVRCKTFLQVNKHYAGKLSCHPRDAAKSGQLPELQNVSLLD